MGVTKGQVHNNSILRTVHSFNSDKMTTAARQSRETTHASCVQRQSHLQACSTKPKTHCCMRTRTHRHSYLNPQTRFVAYLQPAVTDKAQNVVLHAHQNPPPPHFQPHPYTQPRCAVCLQPPVGDRGGLSRTLSAPKLPPTAIPKNGCLFTNSTALFLRSGYTPP